MAFGKDKQTEGYSHAGEDVHDMSLQFGKRGILVGMSPATADTTPREPHAQVVVLAICIEHMLDDLWVAAAAHAWDNNGRTVLCRETVTVAELEKVKVGIPIAGIACDGLQSTKEECLAKHVEVLAQRVEQTNEILGLVTLKAIIVSATLQAIVQNLTEARTHKLLAHEVLQLVALVGLALHGKAALQRRGDFNIIVSVDAQDVFHYIARALDIHSIGRHGQGEALRRLLLDFHLQARHDALDGICRDVLAYQGIHIGIVQRDVEIGCRTRADIDNLHADAGTSKFACHDGSLLQCIYLSVRVDTTLKAEAGIRGEAMTTGTLANPCGVEVGALEEHVLCGLIRTTPLTAKHTSDAHGFLCITDGQIMVREFVFHSVKGDEGSAFGHCLHHHLLPRDHISIEAMQRLAVSHHDIIGDVHDVIDGTQTDDTQLFLQPLGAFFHLTASQRHTAIARASLIVLDTDVNGQ